MAERDAGLRLALWRLHLDNHHATVFPITHPATGEPLPIEPTLADCHALHDLLHAAQPKPPRHTHNEHKCGGRFLPIAANRWPTFHECDTCGARRHSGSCVDEEGKVTCDCGLEELELAAADARAEAPE